MKITVFAALTACVLQTGAMAAEPPTAAPFFAKQADAHAALANSKELLVGATVKDTAGCLYGVGAAGAKLVLIPVVVNGARICANAAPGKWEATSSDTDLKTLVGRWVQIEGKKFVWEVPLGGETIRDAAALNSAAKLRGVARFDQALERLNLALERAAADHSSPTKPLKACVFDDAIVLRTIDQSRCGLPL